MYYLVSPFSLEDNRIIATESSVITDEINYTFISCLGEGGPGEIIEWEMQYKSVEDPEFEFSERVLDLGGKKKWLKGTPILYAINEFQTLEEAQLYRATADL